MRDIVDGKCQGHVFCSSKGVVCRRCCCRCCCCYSAEAGMFTQTLITINYGQFQQWCPPPLPPASQSVICPLATLREWITQRERERETETYRGREGQGQRDRDGQIPTETDRQTDRQTDRDRDLEISNSKTFYKDCSSAKT